MKYPDSSSLHEWMDARVEAYVDGELPPNEYAVFERILDEHPRWQRQVQQAKRIQRELHDLPPLTCPPQVTQTVLEHARLNGHPAGWKTGWRRFLDQLDELTRLSWEPVAAMATLVLIVVASVMFSPTPTQPESSRYTASEVERAEAQAKWALAYIAHVSDETQGTLRREVFQEQIAAPTRRALRPLSSDTESTRNR